MSRTPTSREGPPSAGAPPPPLHGPGAGLRDGLLAAGIFAFALVLIMGTTRDLGFNRDETFYHHYAKVYGSWLLDLAETRDPAVRERLLSKAEVERVWSQNYEHPPLMKVLFGLSWRIFGEKKREVRFLDRRVLRIQGLDRPHGFDEGDQVDILRPLTVGEEHDAADRVAGTATITRRTRGEAMATILEWRPEEDPLAICASPPDEGLVPRHMGGCMARTTGSLQILSESDAFRLPGALCGALLVALLYLFALGFTGRGGALVSALALLFVPRAFFHMHLTCFDIPITFFGFATLVAFWKAERGGGLRWALVTAVLWGLALLVKLNAFFLPVTLGLYWLATLRGRLRKIRPLPFSVPAIPPAFFLMALVGPLMLYLLWPVLWYDPVRSFGRYLAFHLGHEHYYQSYFGQALGAPPFPVTFPFVMTLLTVPVPPLALFLTGAVRTALPWRVDPAAAVAVSRRRWFLAVNALFPIGLIALPSTPVFGGVKHWLLTMPFFCLYAGIGFSFLARAIPGLLPGAWTRRRGVAAAAVAAFAVLLLAPGARDTLRYVDNGTAYYNELIGGLRGAADHRMQRQFWSHATIGGLDHLNRHLPRGAVVDFQDATSGACRMYQFEERLRTDLRCVIRQGRPDAMLFDVEERFTDEEWRYQQRMGTAAPVAEHAVDGVPMIRVYRRDAGLDMARKILDERTDNAP